MDAFVQAHKLDSRRESLLPPEIDIEAPEDLRQLLVRANGSSYANGFFKFINAHAFRHYLQMWNIDADPCLPFIKCAFGHLVFFQQNEYKVLNPVFNSIDQLGNADELAFVMDILLCDRIGLENSFFIDIYEKTFPKLSAPKDDEMYAFVPALGLGGSREVANVQKVKMNEQMLILSQL